MNNKDMRLQSQTFPEAGINGNNVSIDSKSLIFQYLSYYSMYYSISMYLSYSMYYLSIIKHTKFGF